MTRITGTLHEDICAFMASRSVLPKTRNVSGKSCGDKKNTFTFNNIFSEDIVENCCTTGNATDGNTIQRMRFSCWITKATHTHTHAHTQNMYYF